MGTGYRTLGPQGPRVLSITGGLKPPGLTFGPLRGPILVVGSLSEGPLRAGGPVDIIPLRGHNTTY